MIALGFRVKSGYAVAVAVRGPASAPSAVARRVVELHDPKVAATRQPYHADLFTEETDAGALDERVRIVRACAQRAVAALLDGQPLAGERCRAALVVGSVIDPAQVANPHIRAHASEGRLFREALRDALEAHGVACDVVVEKQLAARAAADLRRHGGEIKRIVARFGREVGGPWRADEKAASTAAWMLLPPDA